MKFNEDKYHKIMLMIIESLVVFGFIYIIICFFNSYSHYELLKTTPDNNKITDELKLNPNEKGDALGGILNPIVGVVAIVVTYLAFYIQFLANRQVQNQFKIQQFESQFYEMLRIHKDNVNEMYLFEIGGIKHEGRFVLESVYFELVYFYNSCTSFFDDMQKDEKINTDALNTSKKRLRFVYKIYFFGIENINKKTLSKIENECLNYFERISTFPSKLDEKIRHETLKGNQSRLAHYYRHLFQTVKLVANQEESFITYENKRKYLRVLRAQLTNHEQALLFFNWYSDFGYKWEEFLKSGNKFFTDYRMIHNLYPELILNMYDLEAFKSLRKEKDRKIDSLFEFQDWGN